MPLSAAPLDTTSSSLPVTLLATFCTRMVAARSVMLADAPVSWNFTGTVLPCLKIELPSLLIGWRKNDHETVTVTVNVLLSLLPAASVAVQVTVVVPTANVEPEECVHVGVIEPSTISLADV